MQKRAAKAKLKLVCCKVQANARPDSGIIDGKDRSISPAAVTKTRLNPMIAKSGKDRKIAVYIPTLKKTSGAAAIKITIMNTKNMKAPKTGLNRSGIRMPDLLLLMTLHPFSQIYVRGR